MKKIRVASSASYFNVPAVFEMLWSMDYIFTTNPAAVEALDKASAPMMGHYPVIIYTQHASGQDMRPAQLLGYVNAHRAVIAYNMADIEKSPEPATELDLEVYRLGDWEKIAEAHRAAHEDRDWYNLEYTRVQAAGTRLEEKFGPGCDAFLVKKGRANYDSWTILKDEGLKKALIHITKVEKEYLEENPYFKKGVITKEGE